MKKKESQLSILIGKFVTDNRFSTSTTAFIRNDEADPKEVRVTLSVQLYFGEYILNINNPITILPGNLNLDNLVGREVRMVMETNVEAILIFTENVKVIVNLRDEAYHDPEAMTLYGPNNFCIVWN